MVTLKDLSKEATEFFSMFRRNESAIMEMVKAIKENARPAQSEDRQIIPTDLYDKYAPVPVS